jgi:hypothetical protein
MPLSGVSLSAWTRKPQDRICSSKQPIPGNSGFGDMQIGSPSVLRKDA